MPDLVILELSDDEKAALRHQFSEPYGHEIRIGIFEKLRAALDSPPVEERREFRAVYDENDTTWKSGGVVDDRARAERRCELEARRRPDATNFRVQQRTITTFSDGSELISPWTDLEGEEGRGNG
jgi:hypothetical protein